MNTSNNYGTPKRRSAPTARELARREREIRKRQSAHDRDPRVRLCRQERRRRDQRIARQLDEARVVFLALLAEESAARQRGRPKKSVA